jgi:hypothetical protein
MEKNSFIQKYRVKQINQHTHQTKNPSGPPKQKTRITRGTKRKFCLKRVLFFLSHIVSYVDLISGFKKHTALLICKNFIGICTPTKNSTSILFRLDSKFKMKTKWSMN